MKFFTDIRRLLPPVAMILGLISGNSLWAADEADIQQAIEYVKKQDKQGSVKPNGLGLVSADGENSINLTGLVHFDARAVQSGLPHLSDKDSASVADTFEFRRARLGVNGTMYAHIDYELILNATGTDTNVMDTGFLNFNANKQAQIRVGRFRQPYSLESMTKDASIDFLERSYGDQLGPNKLLGAMVWGEPVPGMTYGLSLAQAGFNEVTNSDQIGGLGTGRITINLGELGGMKSKVLHLGASTNRGNYDITPTTSLDTGSSASTTTRATLLTYRTESRGLTNAYRVQLTGESLSTAVYGGSANDVASVSKNLNNLEFAYANGSFKYQSEYSKMSLSASSPTTTSLSAYNTLTVSTSTYYHELVYNLTGEQWTDAYKGGAFIGVKPLSNYRFGQGGTGAWQVAVRYSRYTANYPGIGSSAGGTTGTLISTGGRAENAESAHTVTYGLNWLINPSTAVKLNYAMTHFDRSVYILSTTNTSTATVENVISLRTQINF